ncbi:MAG TPA: efflux transporter outer membrane subunit [Methylomirabilota bacterium]|nr:efflux transporter outer membrane subunit [Methylomirabilota bacterium]
MPLLRRRTLRKSPLTGQNRIAALLLGVLACGCMVHRPAEHAEPAVTAPPRFAEARPSESAPRPALPAPWWRAFEDPTLDSLIERALAGNLELAAFAARIDQANALLRQARGQLFPLLDAGAQYESRWLELDSSNPIRQESASAGALLDWELDLWGRLRSIRSATRLEARAAAHDWLGARLLISAAVAETYFEILEQREQLQLLREQLDANQTLLELTRLRFGQGQSSIVDVLQQQEQLASTSALVPEIESRLEELEYALDVLLGHAPGTRDRFPAGTLAVPPPIPDTGVPSDLLGKRPDLLAAGDRVTALDYRVGEAIADRLPRVAIGGSLTVAGDPGFDQLIGGALASLAGPVFDAGIRKAEVDRRQAQLRERLADYSGAYLAAVRDVETALLRERKQAERVRRLNSQLEIAQQLLTETRNRYSQGLTDYLPVLGAVVTEQNLQREVITARRGLLSLRVALHRALGGPMKADPFSTVEEQAALANPTPRSDDSRPHR